MKTAIYIEDGIVQLVITPETKFEKNSIKIFQDKPIEVELFSGSFYNCLGGWIRQTQFHQSPIGHEENNDKSLILKIKNKNNIIKKERAL